ncbi:Hypothetical predicted protein [Cloeon dipterum]|nr:Hypothetical predicted protein [Cloeon dipterum]
MGCLLLLLVTLFVAAVALGVPLTTTRVVHTHSGKLQGFVKKVSTGSFTSQSLKPVEVFLGIPYAIPPVRAYRFSPTRTPLPWDGVKMADTMAPVCPQRFPDISNETVSLEKMPKGRLEYLRRLLTHLQNQSEDCLYLNVYAPAQAVGPPEMMERYPVMVYIHGESFEWNSGNPYDGSVLASYTDVVVVTLNYRLGVLGFLNANSAPQAKARVANYGLMDQIAALHWIQQNIALFGGDPGNVTLFGHGTGAACINFLMISPTVVPGLFHRAILLSGSALSSWALVEQPATYALRLAHQLNCSLPEDSRRDHERVVDCLRSAPLDALLKADVATPAFTSAFGPSVDGIVIRPGFRKELVAGQKRRSSGASAAASAAAAAAGVMSDSSTSTSVSNRNYDLLFGVVTNEALFHFSAQDVQAGFEGERRDKIFRTYVRNTYNYHLNEIFFTVVNEYTDWERTVQHPINTRDATIAALSDAQYVAPVVHTGDLLSRTGSTHNGPKCFFYVFDYQTKDGDYPQRMGTVHGEELPYVFGAPLVDGFSHFPRNYTRSEVSLSEAVMLFWASFARTGDPNEHMKTESILSSSKERNRFRNIVWEEYDAVHQKYLEISMKPRTKNHFRAHQLSVWLRLVPELHRAGMEDVSTRHNLFRNHNDPDIYDGSVRALDAIYYGTLDADYSTTGPGGRRGNETALVPSGEPMLTTCVSIIAAPTTASGLLAGRNQSDAMASLEAIPGYGAYSTALSVTIAIGCSLLILNVLIFAGVYYQRDKHRLEVKNMQEQQRGGFVGDKIHLEAMDENPITTTVILNAPTTTLTPAGGILMNQSSPTSKGKHLSNKYHTLHYMQHLDKAHHAAAPPTATAITILDHQQHIITRNQHSARCPCSQVPQSMLMEHSTFLCRPPEHATATPPNGSMVHLNVPRPPPPPRVEASHLATLPRHKPTSGGGGVADNGSLPPQADVRV